MTYKEKYGVPIKSVDFGDAQDYVEVTYIDGRVVREYDIAKIQNQLHDQMKAIQDGEDLSITI
jgi:hypothetical protein